jgi:hypothetical protein
VRKSGWSSRCWPPLTTEDFFIFFSAANKTLSGKIREQRTYAFSLQNQMCRNRDSSLVRSVNCQTRCDLQHRFHSA